MLQKTPQVAEGILVGHEVNAKLLAARVELANFLAVSAPSFARRIDNGNRRTCARYRVEIIDFEIGKVLDQFEQCSSLARDRAKCPASRRAAQNLASRGFSGTANAGRIGAAIVASSPWQRQPGGFTEFNLTPLRSTVIE